jgi:hypothetical protein
MDESLEIPPFYMVSTPHQVIVKDFPLDSLSVDIATGKYYQDMQDNLAVDKDTIEIGFANFFSDSLKIKV